MDRYIEVIGEGEFIEHASRFIAELTLQVRAAKEETASSELKSFVTAAYQILLESGIRDEEFVEGGIDFTQPWYWRKQVGQSASRKLILKVTDFSRLLGSLEKLEPLQAANKERKTISVDMRQPEFEDSQGNKATVLSRAFVDAEQKANKLAAAMHCTLGKPLHVEEGGWSKRNSSFSGDQDWGGDSSRFGYGGGLMLAAGGGAAASPEVNLQRPTRSIFVKCRVRFALQDH